MADDTLRRALIDAIQGTSVLVCGRDDAGDDTALFGNLDRDDAGSMADAALAAVEAHTRQAQAEALREAARMDVRLSDPRTARWFSAEADGIRVASKAFRDALLARADELDPKGDGQ